MLTLISSILVFSAIVLVHEFGHYKAAKSVGIKVYEFAIGMGPTLLKREKDGTIYSIRTVPIGGFVQMEGEEEDSRTPTSFGTNHSSKGKSNCGRPCNELCLSLLIFL